MRLLRYSLCIPLVVCLGCTPARKQSPGGASGGTSPSTEMTKPATGTILSVTDSAGKPLLLVTKGAPKYEVSGPGGKLGALKEDVGKLNIEDRNSKKVGSVKLEGEDVILDDASGKKIAKLKPKEGGYRLKDAADNTLAKIKPREEGGFKIGDDAGNTLAKIKTKGGTILIEDERGRTLYKVTGSVQAATVGVLIADQLDRLQQAALIVGANQ